MSSLCAYSILFCTNVYSSRHTWYSHKQNYTSVESFHDDNAGGAPRKEGTFTTSYRIVLNICFLFVNVHTNNLHVMLKKANERAHTISECERKIERVWECVWEIEAERKYFENIDKKRAKRKLFDKCLQVLSILSLGVMYTNISISIHYTAYIYL